MDNRTAELDPDRPRKVKLAPMTEWRLPSFPPPGEAPPRSAAPPWQWLAIGAGVIGLATVLVVSALGRTASDLAVSGGAPVVRRDAAARPRAAVAAPSILLPSGLSIDREAPLNYALAEWLATAPAGSREFTFIRVAFPPGSADLGPEDRSPLQGFATVLGAYPGARAIITCHGPNGLGAARAKAMRQALFDLAVDPAQVDVRDGGGGEAPMTATVTAKSVVDHGLDA